MNCIDVVEGCVQNIIKGMFTQYTALQNNDTDFIADLKTVLEATGGYLSANGEITGTPQIVNQVLYSYGKTLWLEDVLETKRTQVDSATGFNEAEVRDYFDYFFDYIYTHGRCPH